MLPSTAWRRSARCCARARRCSRPREELLLDCGDGRAPAVPACQAAAAARAARRCCCCTAGRAAPIRSTCCRSAQRLFAQGFERGAPEPARSRRDAPPQPRAVPFLPPARGGGRGARAAAAHLRGAPLQLVGFSLGGNFLLRVAAQARAAQLQLAQASRCRRCSTRARRCVALEQGFPVYELYFVRKWLRSLRQKQRHWPGTYDFARAGAHARPEEHDRGAGAALHRISDARGLPERLRHHRRAPGARWRCRRSILTVTG